MQCKGTIHLQTSMPSLGFEPSPYGSAESSLAIPNSYRESYYSVNADMLLADVLSKALTSIINESQRDSIQFVIDVLENAKERYLVVDDSNGYLHGMYYCS
ncbi:UNVERIFIED_CONTAM: hypothetical protein NCL1_24081 [Trichonephila clavipes]